MIFTALFYASLAGLLTLVKDLLGGDGHVARLQLCSASLYHAAALEVSNSPGESVEETARGIQDTIRGDHLNKSPDAVREERVIRIQVVADL